MKEVTITEDQLKNMLDKIKELEEAKQLIKLLKEEVGFAERGYTQKGWVKSYCGGKPNYCTPEETPDVDAVNMSRDRVDETAKGEHDSLGSEWVECVKLPIVVHVRKQRDGETHISTREGITPVLSDDLIMRGVAGEEYPIGRELFERTYTFDTAPPKREWVGLTDEEIIECFDSVAL